jgi:hypothetical protein
MTLRLLSVAALLLLGGESLLWCGEPRRLQLPWHELGPRITGHKVALVLPNGTHIEGKVRSVEPDALRLNVSKTSDRKLLPKGERLIPRQSVSLMRVTEYRKLGRLLVTSGALAVAAGIVAANYPDLYEGAVVAIVPAVTAGGLVGVGLAGYYAGKRLDKTVTEIQILPDQAPRVEATLAFDGEVGDSAIPGAAGGAALIPSARRSLVYRAE